MPLHAERLRQRRAFLKLTQQDVAGRAGVHQQNIARWESGKQDIAGDALARLAKALNCTTDWLLGLVDQPNAYARPQELSTTERVLLDLYRQRKLPEMITRLVDELAGANPQADLVVDRPNQPQVPGEDVTPDR